MVRTLFSFPHADIFPAGIRGTITIAGTMGVMNHRKPGVTFEPQPARIVASGPSRRRGLPVTDVELASAFHSALSDARRAADRWELPQAEGQCGGNIYPIWEELSGLYGERLNDISKEAGVGHPAWIPSFRWEVPKNEVRDAILSALESMSKTAAVVHDYFNTLERTDPVRHATGTLKRIAEAIPVYRDRSKQGFLHNLSGRFATEGSNEIIGEVYSTIVRMAEVVGVSSPCPRPLNVCDWPSWVAEWDGLRRYCLNSVSRLEGESPNGPTQIAEPALKKKQREILNLLKGQALTGPAIAKALDCTIEKLTTDHLTPLKKKLLIKNDRSIGGYYRPDAPPKL